MSSLLLENKLAIVTGGGSGIGRATCQVLAREGARVIVSDVNLSTAQETVDTLPDPSQHMAIYIDVSKKSSIEEGLKAVLDRYKTPATCIVNNAGWQEQTPFLSITEENYDGILAVNLKGTFMMSQVAANAMVSHGITKGSIVNISSILSKSGLEGLAHYTASKGGVTSMTKVVAKELASKGIRVNCVFPGVIYTNILKTVPQEVIDSFVEKVPMKRIGNPEEIGEVVAFLLSDRSSYMTGSIVEATGGYEM